jgi:peroxiredoxin
MLELGTPAPDCELIDDVGRKRRLAEFWAQGPAAIVFVRHLGCPFCRQEAAVLKADAAKFQQAGATIALVTMSSADDAAGFRQQLSLPFACLSDPDQACYRAFQVPRGSMLAVAGPQTWGAAAATFFKYGAGAPSGDVKQLSGAFVVDRSGTIRYAQHARNSADLPSHAAMLDAVRAANT